MNHFFQSLFFALFVITGLSVSGQNYRVEKDALGEMKIPSNAHYGLKTARAMKHSNIGTSKLAEFPEFLRSLAFVKLAALEVNRENGEINPKKAMMLNRACRSIINGGHTDAFQFGLYNGSHGYFENAAINEVLANLAIEMTGATKGNYKIVDPEKDVNVNQNYQSVYQTSLNLTVITQNEMLLKELELLNVALSSFSDQSEKFRNVNSSTPVALEAVQSNFEKSKDSLVYHIANLQRNVAQLKYHSENGSSSLIDMTNIDFQNQFSKTLLTTTGVNFSFKNPNINLDTHFENAFSYMESISDMNDFLITTCKLIQVLDNRDTQDNSFSFASINSQNDGPKYGNTIPETVIENCIQIDGTQLAIINNLASKKKKSINDVCLVDLNIMVSQQKLIKAVKLLRKGYLD